MMHHSLFKSGADSFMPKPFESLIEFQQTILGLLPNFQQENGLSIVQNDTISPDSVTYREDLCNAHDLLIDGPDLFNNRYVLQSLESLSQNAGDEEILKVLK